MFPHLWLCNATFHMLQVSVNLRISFAFYSILPLLLICARRDKGFSYIKYPSIDHLGQAHPHQHLSKPTETTETICDGSLFLCYILPPLLHLSAFAQTIYLLRLTENEHLQTLFEKVIFIIKVC